MRHYRLEACQHKMTEQGCRPLSISLWAYYTPADWFGSEAWPYRASTLTRNVLFFRHINLDNLSIPFPWMDTLEKGNTMDRKTLERENKQLQEGIDALRAGYGFHSFLISLLTMKAFYPETWYKSYDAKKLLESLDFHIERVGMSTAA